MIDDEQTDGPSQDSVKLRGRLKVQLKQNPGIKQTAVAAACGVSPQAVSGWLKTGRIDKKHFPALAELFGTTVSYWITGDFEQNPNRRRDWQLAHPENGARPLVRAYAVRGVDGEDGVDPQREVLIPVSDIEVSGGQGSVVPEYVETKYRLPFQIEWLRQFNAKPEEVRIARVRGSSMEPVLWDGDKAVINTGQRRIRNDRVFALIYGGEARVKRLSMMADGRLRISSDNPDKTRYPDEFVEPDDMEQIFIIGQVIDRSGGGGL